MPITSYLAYPRPGAEEELAASMSLLPGCVVTPSQDRGLFVLVTDTVDEEADHALLQSLQSLPELNGLSLVFRHEAPPEEDGGNAQGPSMEKSPEKST